MMDLQHRRRLRRIYRITIQLNARGAYRVPLVIFHFDRFDNRNVIWQHIRQCLRHILSWNRRIDFHAHNLTQRANPRIGPRRPAQEHLLTE